MSPIKVILVDDNQDSLEIINYFINQNPYFQVIGQCGNGEDLIEVAILKRPDLIITDINMPKKNGMQAIKECLSIYPNLKFIFISGYNEYAIEAFEVAAVDYIVKPVEKVRFLKALEKAKNIIDLEKGEMTYQHQEQKVNMLSIKDTNGFRFIPQADIFFIEKVGKKSLIYTKNRIFETNQTLGKILNHLDNNFYQGHRSYIINLKKISQITPQNETYIVSFHGFDRFASISKLKINEVRDRISMFQ